MPEEEPGETRSAHALSLPILAALSILRRQASPGVGQGTDIDDDTPIERPVDVRELLPRADVLVPEQGSQAVGVDPQDKE
jgi:hypothetical protein